MISSENSYDKTKSALRIYGPLLIGVGLILSIIGIGAFINALINIFDGQRGTGPMQYPILFLLSIPGFLLLGLGIMMTKVGYLKEISKYAAKETTPAATITTTAIRAAVTDDHIPCPSCSNPIEPNSKFCSQCGEHITNIQCKACQSPMEAADQFCANCGQAKGDTQ